MHVLFLDVEALKNPGAQGSHLGWAVTEPVTMVNLPGGHLVWAVQESPLFVLEVAALKNPVAQSSHLWGMVMLALVYLPGGHLVLFWAVHWSIWQPDQQKDVGALY